MTTISDIAAPALPPAARNHPLRVVGVSGSLHTPSKTSALVTAIVDAVGARTQIDRRLIEVADLAPAFSGVLRREDLPPVAIDALRLIETADLLVVASPVYRASFTGLFKHLFDFVDQYALVDQPVLLAATGGGERHALIIEHQLRPLFGFFQALTLPLGVYASTADFDGHRLVSAAAHERIDRAVSRGLPLIEQSAQQQLSEYVSTW
jgi:FMN reductase